MAILLAVDQGTTSSRAMLFDADGNVLGVARRAFQQYFPHPGWVEHDASEIWRTQRDCIAEVLQGAGVAAADVAAMGITNQRETTVLWERKSGKPLAPAIVWQDRRTAALCDRLREQGRAAEIRSRTGLEIDAYFSASKLAWLLEHIPHARQRAEAGELAFGTIDSWLAWNLSGGSHITDPSNASRTMLFNLHTGDWDDTLLELFMIPRALLPRVVDSAGVLAQCDRRLFGAAIPIAAIAGDQQAATFGQACLLPGMAKNTYGTGCFVVSNTGDQVRTSTSRLLSTIGWRLGGRTTYLLEGSVFMGGALIQWLRDGLGIIKTAAESEALAASVPDSGGVVFVPAFTGLGAPHWDPYARGTLLGLTRGTNAAHIARAALEAVALQCADLIEAMSSDGAPVTELRVDGGACANNLLLQLQADLLGVPVVRPRQIETTAFGAATLAGVGVGLWRDAGELASHWREERRFEPQASADWRSEMKLRWRRGLQRAQAWEQPDGL